MGNTVSFDYLARDRATGPTKAVGRAMEETAGKAGALTKAFGVVSAGSRGLRSSFGLVGKGALFAAGAAGIGGLVEGFKAVVGEARDAQKTGAQTAAVLKSTGGVAHVSASQVGALATAISNKVGVDDEAIQSGANLLLTFTRVRNEAGKGNNVFDQATQTVTDMAAAMNHGAVTTDGLKTASIQVGKALNDPLKGITALTKVGVTFDEGQKKQIAMLVKHHDVLGAQKIILGELNKEFGGSAAAGATATQKLGVVFGNLEESIGTALLPIIDKAANWLSKILPAAVNAGITAVSNFAGAIKSGLRGEIPATGGVFTYVAKATTAVTNLATWVRDTGLPAISKAFSTLKVDLTPVAQAFVKSAQTWGTSLITGVKNGLATGDWSGLGQTVGQGIVSAIGAATSFAKSIASKIGDLLAKVDWVGVGIAVGKQVPSLLVGLAAGLLNFDLGGLLKGLAAHWQLVLFAVISVAFAPARVIGKVAEVLSRIPLVGRLLAWALEHFAGFSKGLVRMVGDSLAFMGRAFLTGFRRVFPNVGARFASELAILPLRLALVTLRVVEGAQRMMRGLGNAIARGIGGVIAKIGELIARMLRPFVGAAGWLVRRGIEFVGGLLRGVASRLGSAAAAAGRVISTVTTPFRAAGGWLVGHGRDLIVGLLNGARGALRSVGQWARDIGGAIVRAVKGFFGIHSPSTVFAGIGGHLMAGLAKGMIAHNPVALIGKVFGGMTGALRSLFSKGIVSATAGLGSKALSALGGLVKNVFGGGASSNSGNESLVRGMAAQFFGWTGSQWDALRAVIMRESGFNNTAQNPTSTAFGMFQFLDSTWGAMGVRKTSNPNVQALAGLQYIRQRYGDPRGALFHEMQFGWYGKGLPPTVFSQPTLIGVGERGPETVTVVPHGRGGAAGQVLHVTVNLNGPVMGNAREVAKQLAPAMQQELRKALLGRGKAELAINF